MYKRPQYNRFQTHSNPNNTKITSHVDENLKERYRILFKKINVLLFETFLELFQNIIRINNLEDLWYINSKKDPALTLLPLLTAQEVSKIKRKIQEIEKACALTLLEHFNFTRISTVVRYEPSIARHPLAKDSLAPATTAYHNNNSELSNFTEPMLPGIPDKNEYSDIHSDVSISENSNIAQAITAPLSPCTDHRGNTNAPHAQTDEATSEFEMTIIENESIHNTADSNNIRKIFNVSEFEGIRGFQLNITHQNALELFCKLTQKKTTQKKPATPLSTIFIQEFCNSDTTIENEKDTARDPVIATDNPSARLSSRLETAATVLGTPLSNTQPSNQRQFSHTSSPLLQLPHSNEHESLNLEFALSNENPPPLIFSHKPTKAKHSVKGNSEKNGKLEKQKEPQNGQKSEPQDIPSLTYKSNEFRGQESENINKEKTRERKQETISQNNKPEKSKCIIT